MASREQKLFEMRFADVYPLYVSKVKRKNREESELIKVITWLTGFDSKTLKIHSNAKLITGSICGVKIIEIEDPLMTKILRSGL